MVKRLPLQGLAVSLGLATSSGFAASIFGNGDVQVRAPPGGGHGGDPCAVIGGQKWVAPSDVRACFTSVKVNETLRENMVDVINKTLAFHTSVNYQLRAPEPFTSDVHEDLLGDLARIKRQRYASEYDLHIDLSRTLKRLNDGHCVWINSCYDSLFLNFLPIPLALLTESDGSQNVHIAPEAFSVASAEFADEIDVWQNALPSKLKGQLESLNGAKILKINGQDPNVAVDANAAITGSFQALGTRQNSFFSSYQRSTTGWNYIMGNFAQQSLPLSDSVTLQIVRTGQTRPETITLPYRSRFGTSGEQFTDTASWRANNCVAIDGTNGVDESAAASTSSITSGPVKPIIKFQQQPKITDPQSLRKQPLDVIIDSTPLTDVALPPGLTPALPAVNGSRSVSQFYLLDDKKTGVMALGSFSDSNFNTFLLGMLAGLQSLKSMGATQLIVDVSNNGGGFICAAHWLHRIIAGPKSTTIPQAGLDTKARDGPLARQIVEQIVGPANLDPTNQLLYNPVNWANASSVPFPKGDDWLQPPVDIMVNGRADAFSQRLGSECPESEYPTAPPAEALFDPKKVVIVNNGRCASSCSLFSITMNKKEGSKTVVIGGRKGVEQNYCGTVGGQSTDFSTIDTEIKSTQLKSNPLAPPDLLVNGVQGITWRLAFGVEDTTQPEEWQDHPADLNLPVTAALVNNPVAIWEEVTKRLLS